MENKRFRDNYASLRGRGLSGNKDYILTIHKQPVLAPGYEYLTEAEKQCKSEIRRSAKVVCDKNERFENSISRSRSSVIQIGANNPWEFFVTLTFSKDKVDDRFDLASVGKTLRKFFNHYKERRSPGFRYLIIPEKHEDGAWHFHGFFMGINSSDLEINKHGYLDFVPYREKFGYISFGKTKSDPDACLGDECSVGRIRDLKKTASYITKYITKDMFGDAGFAEGSHLFFASKGLLRDEKITEGCLVYGADQFHGLDYEYFETEFLIKVKLDDVETGKKCIKPYAPPNHLLPAGVMSDDLRVRMLKRYQYILDIKYPPVTRVGTKSGFARCFDIMTDADLEFLVKRLGVSPPKDRFIPVSEELEQLAL